MMIHHHLELLNYLQIQLPLIVQPAKVMQLSLVRGQQQMRVNEIEEPSYLPF